MSSVLARPRAVIFDWDNTLVNSWLCIQESFNRTFRHFGMPDWSLDDTRANVARSLRDSFPAMFGARWEEAREVFYRSFEDIHLSHLRPLPGAGAMLAELEAAGIYLAVVSNKVGDYLRTEAAALGWSGHFGRLVGATDAEADKPHPAPVRLALAPSGLAPGADVWFVGDWPSTCNVRSIPAAPRCCCAPNRPAAASSRATRRCATWRSAAGCPILSVN